MSSLAPSYLSNSGSWLYHHPQLETIFKVLTSLPRKTFLCIFCAQPVQSSDPFRTRPRGELSELGLRQLGHHHHPSMSSTSLFTTDDGDIILRARTEPDSKHDFRVHKFILSLASPVFKDMFAFPQPLDQNQNEHPDIPVVDIPDSPEVFDTILRYIYPGVELPKITKVSILSALFSAADKYNIASIHSVLKESLKTFLPAEPFRVYIIACRFGFLAEAKEAARLSNSWSMINQDYGEEIQNISGPDLYRYARFVQLREREGRSKIEDALGWYELGHGACNHWDDAKDFYFRLAKEVEDAFARNPCLELKDLFEIFDKIPDPLLGCKPEPESAEWYYDCDNYKAFSCPLVPMSIRKNLQGVVRELHDLNQRLLEKAFGKGIGSD